MRILSRETHFRFMSRRGAAAIVSAMLIVGSIVAFVANGLNLGIEFTGGVEFEAGYAAPDVEARSFSVVFPQIGGEVAEAGSLAMIFVLIMIFVYIMFRFQWRFSAGAVAALAHDVVVTVGLFALFQFPVDSSVIAALLAVIGYSLNDTVVVFDRIRENFLSLRGEESDAVIDRSINQMLARTIITGVTTLLVLIALLVLGGESVRSFSIALIAGIVVGTYSSIYVASAVALQLGVSARDLMPPEPEGDEIDELP